MPRSWKEERTRYPQPASQDPDNRDDEIVGPPTLRELRDDFVGPLLPDDVARKRRKEREDQNWFDCYRAFFY